MSERTVYRLWADLEAAIRPVLQAADVEDLRYLADGGEPGPWFRDLCMTICLDKMRAERRKGRASRGRA